MQFQKTPPSGPPLSLFTSDSCRVYPCFSGFVRLSKPLVYRSRHNSTVREIGTNEKNVLESTREHNRTRKFDFRTFLSVTPTKIVRYRRNLSPSVRDFSAEYISRGAKVLPDGSLDLTGISRKLTEINSSAGIISQKANNRISASIDWLLHLAQTKKQYNPRFKSWYYWKANFVTVTLPSRQIHSDNFIKKNCLNHLLVSMARKWGVNNYIWRAEAQRNGRIHFHIVTDKYIPYEELTSEWNKIVNKYGYVDRYVGTLLDPLPNSTDVHSLRKVKNIGAYLSKYCGKNSKGIIILPPVPKSTKMPSLLRTDVWRFPKKGDMFFRSIRGRLWGCSQELSKLCKCKFEANIEQKIEFEAVRSCTLARKFVLDYVEIIFTDAVNWGALQLHSISAKVQSFVNNIVNLRVFSDPVFSDSHTL